MKNIDALIYERKQVLKWLINGYGTLGIELNQSTSLTKECIVENYNVKPEYFEPRKPFIEIKIGTRGCGKSF